MSSTRRVTRARRTMLCAIALAAVIGSTCGSEEQRVSSAKSASAVEDRLPRAATTSTTRRSEFADTTTTAPTTTVTLPPTALPPTTAPPATAPPSTAAPTTVAARRTPPPTAAPASSSGCHASYEGECIPADVSDADCAGGSGNGPYYVKATVKVVGPDEFGLDADNDGWGCERS